MSTRRTRKPYAFPARRDAAVAAYFARPDYRATIPTHLFMAHGLLHADGHHAWLETYEAKEPTEAQRRERLKAHLSDTFKGDMATRADVLRHIEHLGAAIALIKAQHGATVLAFTVQMELLVEALSRLDRKAA